MYSDGLQWITNPQAMSVQFAFSILYAICPELLRPVGFNFQNVNRARKAITNVYSRGGLVRGECNDWGEADKQCAYMLRWFLIHCQFVPQLLRSTPNILSVFPSGKPTPLTCLYSKQPPLEDMVIYFISLREYTIYTSPIMHRVWRPIYGYF